MMDTDKRQRYVARLKGLLKVMLIVLVLGVLLSIFPWHRKGDATLENVFFLLSCDSVEFGMTSLCCFVAYFTHLNQTLAKRLLGGFVIFLILLLVGFFKELRMMAHSELYESMTISDLYKLVVSNYSGLLKELFLRVLQYVGYFVLLFMLLIGIDKIDVIFDNKYTRMKENFKKMQSQLMQWQLNPHFLYNAFNSLYSLSIQQHPKTSEAILTLSNLMRYITDSDGQRIHLSKEIEFINQYLSIEKIRFGDAHRINFKVIGAPSSLFIAPMMLITLVENAFKHGFYNNNQQSFVSILLSCEKGGICFQVENAVLPSELEKATKRKGVGLVNLKKRLQLSYGKKATLKLSKNNGIFKTVLKIDSLS